MIKFIQDFTKYPKDLDNTKWRINYGGHGFGNNELQYYKNDHSNYYIDNLGLHIVSKKEKYDKNEYTSCKISSIDTFMYGKISFEIILPKYYGSWPAIWMLSPTIKDVGWPSCGEIDLMEYALKYPNKLHFSLHSKYHNHKNNTHRTYVLDNVDVNQPIKIDVYWQKDGFFYFVDGKKIHEFKKEEDWPFDQPFLIIMNMAVGGFFPNNPKEDYLNDEFIIKKIIVTDEEYHG